MAVTMKRATKSLMLLGIPLLRDVVERKTTIPVLQTVRVFDRDGKRYAHATDLDIWAEVPMDTLEPGLYEFVGKELVPSKHKVENFPVMPPFKALAGPVTIPKAIGERIITAISCEESRYTLNGALIHVEAAKNVILSTTDGHRLTVERFANAGKAPAGKYLLPRNALRLANKHTPKEGSFALGFAALDTEAGKYIQITVPTGVLLTRALTGNYPSYEAVLPKDYPGQQSFDRAELLDALTRIKPFLNERSDCAVLHITTDNTATVTASNDDHEKVVTIAAQTEAPVTKLFNGLDFALNHGGYGIIMPMRIDGKGGAITAGPVDATVVLRIGMNHAYLVDMVKNMTGDRVYLGFKDNQSAMSWADHRFTADAASAKPAIVAPKVVAKAVAKVVSRPAEEPYAYLLRAS